jgi:YggT family protein
MNSFLAETGVFLVQIAFGLYILAALLRLLFQFVRADFYNPLAQFLVALTNPVLRPLRRVIPGLFGVDVASVVLLLALQMFELYLIALLVARPVSIDVLIYSAVIELIVLTLYVFVVAIVVRALLSWVVPYGAPRNPAMGLLMSLTDPLLRPARRWVPAVGGVDLSPLVVMALLWIALAAVRHFLVFPPWLR